MNLNKNAWRILLSVVVFGLLTGAFLVVNNFSGQNALDNRDYERREVAKGFSLPVIGRSKYFPTGDVVNYKDLGGKPLLLHFWASWCAVCREEKPDLDAFWEKHKDEDVLVLSIASFDTKEAMDSSKLIAKPTFTVALDEEGTIANAYKVSALPVTVLIDEEGYIVRTFKGVLKPYDFAAIETYLASRKKAH